ncbi:hypothetical protein RA23_15030 [Leisingera sp. ANG-S3]|nr:hypothetical protein RA23_15030 [Leisingera sp. ANG-S3]
MKDKQMDKPKTMKDAELQLPGLGYAASFEKNLRASLRKSAKVYRTDLSRISADLAAFNRKWGKGRVHIVPAPFKSAQEFKSWRKNVRMILTRLSGVPRHVPLIPACATVLTTVRDNQGKGKILGANSDLTIGVVVREASRSGLPLADLTPNWIDRTALDLPNRRRKSFRRGLVGLNRLIERQDELPGLAGLLPAAPLPQPRMLRPEVSNWRRSAGNPAAALIWSDFDRIMSFKQFGEEGPQFEGTPAEFKQSSIDGYETSLNWLLRELAAQDLIEDSADLKEAITHPNLVAAINHWITTRKARGQSAETSTLHCHVSRLVHLAIVYLGVCPKEEKRLVKLRRKPAIRTNSVGKMSTGRERWIKDFDRNIAKQEKAHLLPELLMKRSKAILARTNNNRKVRPSEMMMALRMGVTAVQVAILFRASPVRSTNLRTLRMRGEEAELDTEEFMQDPRLRELRLKIPGEQVKNNADIDEIADDDLGPILHWYLTEIRPRLVAAHPFGKNHADSDYLFPSTTERPMERSGFAATFRAACLEVGFDMTMHQARHVCVYWILSVDPNAWGEAAALLGDDEMTVRKYYGWLNERRASEAGRQKLREKRAFSGKHRQGDFADAT